MNPTEVVEKYYEAERQFTESRNSVLEVATCVRDGGASLEDWSQEEIREVRRLFLLLVGEGKLSLPDEITVRSALDALRLAQTEL